MTEAQDAASRLTHADVRAAREVIAGQVMRTPMLPAPPLSAITGAEVFVKYENLQVTNSFKERGALVKLASLSDDERRRGVIAMSAGNHAQAVALHASRLGIPATIVMPETTPLREGGGDCAPTARPWCSTARRWRNRRRAPRRSRQAENRVWVHPYDDPAVMAGQGTIACEMLEDVPDLDMLVIPIGGGGLIGGNAVAAKAIRPAIEIVGVEARALSLHVERGPWRQPPGRRADAGRGHRGEDRRALDPAGGAGPRLGHRAAGESDLERAVNLYLTRQKTIAEGAGAAGLAAMLAEPERFRGRKVGLILCGGNIDPRILASIMVRELERESRIVSLRITIPDRPGVLGTVATLIGRLGGNILEVEHRRLFLDTPAKGTKLDVTVETRDGSHAHEILAALEAEGLPAVRIDSGGGRLG
jgi:threonine dehydratase